MIRIGGHENEQRRLDFHHAGDDGKPIETRHLDIEENKVGLMGLDRTNGFAAVEASVDHFDIGMCLEPQLKALDRQFLVIDEDCADGHAVSCSRYGMSIITENPPPAWLPNSMR